MEEHVWNFKEREPDQGYQVTANPSAFEQLQRVSELTFGRPVEELDFDEASCLISGVVQATTREEGGGQAWNTAGRVIVDSEVDGQEAFRGYNRQLARNLAPRMDDERELIIRLTSDKTLWDRILGRKPRVEQTFRFRKDPPQHA